MVVTEHYEICDCMNKKFQSQNCGTKGCTTRHC